MEASYTRNWDQYKAKNDDAFANFTEALSIYRELRDNQGMADSLKYQGNLGYKRAMKNDDEAARLEMLKDVTKSYTEALRVYRFLDQKDSAGDSLAGIARAVRAQKNYRSAIKYYEDAQTDYNSTDNKKGIAQVNYEMGISYFYLKEYDKAISVLTTGQQTFTSVQDPVGSGNCRQVLGDVYMQQNDFKAAADAYAAGVRDMTNQKHNVKEYAELLVSLASTLNRSGDHKEASKDAGLAYNAFKSIDDKDGMARSDNKIGAVARADGKYPDALKVHSEALNLYQSLGNVQGTAETNYLIGKLYETQWDYDKSIEFYEKAIADYRQTKDVEGLAISLNDISAIYKAKGRDEDARKATEESQLLYRQIQR